MSCTIEISNQKFRFLLKMVNRLGVVHTVAYALTTCDVSAVSSKIFVVQFNSDKCGINH